MAFVPNEIISPPCQVPLNHFFTANCLKQLVVVCCITARHSIQQVGSGTHILKTAVSILATSEVGGGPGGGM